MKKTIILKLGGSVVTYKNRSTPVIRRSLVQSIGQTLAKEYHAKKHRLILIHGAGSFGHLHAHAHGLTQGTKDHSEKLLRAVENQSLDAKLNAELASIFVNSGLIVTGMPTRTLAINARGKLQSLEPKSIRAALDQGVIPLLHGDMVFDNTWGLSICSGDVLATQLAQIFSAEAVFFASDVDGIFSQDPHQFSDASLIEETTLAKISEGTFRLGSSHNVDVTGGLSKKFSLFQTDSRLKTIYLFNGLAAKNFSFVFNPSRFFGTRIQVKKMGRG